MSGTNFANQKLLPNAPDEQISAVSFLSSNEDEIYVAAASWDGSLRMWDFKKETLIFNEKFCDDGMPILSVSSVGPYAVALGGVDRSVHLLNFESFVQKGNRGETLKIGAHEGTVTSVEFSREHNVIVTGGRDSKIRLWSNSKDMEEYQVGNIATDGQVFTMSSRGHLIAAALSGGSVGVWDIRNTKKALKTTLAKENLNVQCIAISPDMKKLVYGTAEGKACVESIDKSNSSKGFTFHAHVDKVTGIAHPVNAVSFIEGTSRFLTGGSDGRLRIWDPDTRKSVADCTPYPNEIAAIDTTLSGKYAVVACSYLDDREFQEETEIPPNEVYIRNLADYALKNE